MIKITALITLFGVTCAHASYVRDDDGEGRETRSRSKVTKVSSLSMSTERLKKEAASKKRQTKEAPKTEKNPTKEYLQLKKK